MLNHNITKGQIKKMCTDKLRDVFSVSSLTQEQYATELLRLRSCLNNAHNIAKGLSEDTKLECEDRLAALQSMLDARLSMVQLLEDVDMIRKVAVLPPSQTKPYEERYEWKENAERVRENETE
jgi:hypothetical protein